MRPLLRVASPRLRRSAVESSASLVGDGRRLRPHGLLRAHRGRLRVWPLLEHVAPGAPRSGWTRATPHEVCDATGKQLRIVAGLLSGTRSTATLG